MAQVERMTLEMDVIAKVDGAIGGINKIKSTLQGIKMPPKLGADLEKSFSNLGGLFEKYKDQVKNGFNTKGDVSNFAKTAKQIDNEVDRLSRNLHKLTGEKLTLNIETDKLKNAQNELTKLISQKEKLMSDVKGSFGLGEYFDAFRKVSGGRNTKVFGTANILQTSLEQGNLTKALEDIKALEAAYNRMKDTKQAAFQDKTGVTGSAAISELRRKVEEAIQSQTTYNQKIETTRQELENIPTQMMNDASKQAEKAAQGMDKLATETKQVTASSTEAARATQSMSQQLQDLQHTTQYFFSLRNMINLFRRGVQDAVQSVKELDAAMTDTAVVTDYKVSDLWGMLPEYTKIANELGATTQGAYETMTLYFQQGLDQQQAFEIGAETMKMARIAGLEYAEATDMMTAALRGFNMELNETSAQRINDVYSKLAAVTASDTEELGTAMQRTASIAHSAGMSFEGTTAFLAQAIETTREPAENLGTAMKTIIARFQEMKKNPLEMVEVDGEEVSYNKVDEALQSIGVSLKDTNGQFRELDQVFLDISQRWDGLTQTQQRYIATIAAGSRQQSRFIAMMSNYNRTVELMDAANNSAGASEEQFGKTMDSLEAKLNQLHNAWQAFTMGIANNGMIKFAVDGVTSLLTVTNNLINTLSLGSPVLKSFLSLFTAFTGLKVAGKFANSLIGGLGGLIDPQSGFFRGFFGGAIGNRAGANAAQAHAISDPIVQAINNQTAALGGKITANGTAQPVNNNVPNFKDYTNALTGFRNLSRQAGKTSIQDVFGSLSGINGKQQSMILSSQQGTMRAINAGMKDLFKSKNLREESQKFGIQMADGITTGLNKGNIIGADLAKMIGSKDLYKIAESAGPEVAQAYTQAVQAELENNQTSIYDAAEKLWHQKARGGDASYTLEQAVKDAKAQHLEKWAENFDLSQYMTPTLTKGQQLQNTINGLGSGITTTGQAFTTFGMILSNLGLQGVGSAFLSLGSVISSVGMTISSIGNAFPNLFKKIGEGQKLFSALKSSIADAGLSSFMKGLGGVAIAGIALTAVIKIHQAIEKRAKDNAEKVTKTYEDAISKSTEKISSLTSAKDTFAELSKGVDQYGNNISLTQDEYDEYLKTSREIADLAPELIRGYDAQGNAIIATGAAIDELIAKEEELKKTATETFVTNSSMNDLMGGIRVSDAFKKYGAKVSTSQYAINGNATDTGGAFNKQMASIRTALKTAGADFESISQQLFGKEINLFNPSQDDLRLIAEHYNDIINLVESQNSELTEKQKEGLQDAFSGLGEGWNDMLGELQPLSQSIGQYLSSEGLDTIGLGLGEEFTESFNKGLESLTMTAAMENWDASKIKEEARNYAEGFKAMTAEGSEYANIMEKVTAEQEKYDDAIGDPGAINNYKEAVEDYAIQLENLADKYDDGTVAGELFANSLRETAGHIRNYATESVVSLGEAINTLSDEFTAARGAQERFQEATKGGDYYTAAEGYKSIIETVLDEKNKAGDGSLTFWAGADELLGKDFVDNSTYAEVITQINKIKDCFEDGADGVLAFNNLLVENADKLEGLGHVEDGGWVFDLQNEDLAEYAKTLNMSEEALAGLIDKARQWVPIDLGDPAKIRQALEASEYSMRGTSTKGEDLLYTSESEFRNEARQQGIRGDDYTQTKADAEAKGVRFLNVENLTAKNGEYANQVLDNIGLKGADKTLDNAVAALTKMGFSLEDQQAILTSKGIKLADGEASKEQIAESYNEQAYALENPTVAGIANDTGIIASAATAMLASMGILTQEAKNNIATATNEENNRASIKAADQDYTTGEAYLKGTSDLRSQISANNDTIALLQQGISSVGADSERGKELQAQIDELNAANDRLGQGLTDIDNKWAEKLKEAQEGLQNVGKTQEEQALIDNFAVDISSMMGTENLGTAMQSLTAFEEAANLSHTAVANLAQEFVELRATDLGQLTGGEINALLTALGLTAEEAREVKNELQSPFRIETQLTGEDLDEYINNVDGLTSGVKTIALNAELSGEEKVEGIIDEINNTFGNGDTKKKTVIIEATSKLATGDKEGANKLLTEAFGEDKAEEITKQLSVLYDGSIANAGELQSSLNSQLDNIIDTATGKTKEVAVDVRANVKANYKQAKVKDQNATVNYKRGTQAEAKDSKAGVDYNKIIHQKQPEDGKAGVSYNYISYQKPPETKHAKVIYDEEDARGRNYSIPAHHSLSFGSAAGGMNVPKPKKPHGSQITALVGEEGFEVGYIPSEARSVIFGANGPEMTTFPKDTIIYPHDQSKEILRRGKGSHIKAGSYQGGLDSVKSSKSLLAALGVTTGSGGGSGGSNGKGTRGGSGNPKIEKEVEKLIAKGGKVIVWWDNQGHIVDKLLRNAEKSQKLLDKLLNQTHATLTDISKDIGQTIADYKKSIEANQTSAERAGQELQMADYGTEAQQKANEAYKKANTKKNRDKLKELEKEKKEAKKSGNTKKVKQIQKKIDKNALTKAKKARKKANKEAIALGTSAEISYEMTKVTKKNGKTKKSKVTKKANVNMSKYIMEDPNNPGTYILNEDAINEVAKKNQSKAEAIRQAGNKIIDDKTKKKEQAEDNIEKAQEAIEKLGQEIYDTFFGWEIELTRIWNITQKIEELNRKIARKNALDDLVSAQLKSGKLSAEDAANQTLTNFSKRLGLQLDVLSEQRKAIDQTRKDLENQYTGNDISDLISIVEKKLESGDLDEGQTLAYTEYLNELKDQEKTLINMQRFTSLSKNADGTVSIDFDTEAFEKARMAGDLTGTEAKAIQDLVKEIEEGTKNLDDLLQSQPQSLTELYNTLSDLDNQWADYESQLIEINEESNRKEIEQVKKLSDSIKKSMDDLLDQVKRKLDERRKQEDNRKTELDISKKQQRLAMLRADTSGGHQLEIAQLEQEIAEAQESYGRTLEDQLIEKLQEQSDEATKQRERQIELQEELATTTNNIAQVQQWMANPDFYKAEIQKQYRENKGYDETGPENQAKIDAEFEEFFSGLLSNRQMVDKITTAINSESVQVEVSVVKNDEEIKPEKPAATAAENKKKREEAAAAKPATPSPSSSGSTPNTTDWSGYKGFEASGYTEDDLKLIGVSKESLKDMSPGAIDHAIGFKVNQAKQEQAQAEKDYQAFLTARGSKTNSGDKYWGQIGKTGLEQQIERGKKLNYDMAKIMGDLGGTDALTWKEVITAAKKANFTVPELIAIRNGSNWSNERKNNFGKAVNTVYKLPQKDKKGKVIQKKLKTSFKTGGLADFTGPAWLDGTPSKPELVLNTTDTKNFIALKDILSSVLSSAGSINNSYGGDTTYEININVDHITNDYDVDKMAERIKKIIVKDSSYRNVTQVRNFR